MHDETKNPFKFQKGDFVLIRKFLEEGKKLTKRLIGLFLILKLKKTTVEFSK